MWCGGLKGSHNPPTLLGTLFYAAAETAFSHARCDACKAADLVQQSAVDSVIQKEQRGNSFCSEPPRFMPPTDPNDISIQGFGGPFLGALAGAPQGLPQVSGTLPPLLPRASAGAPQGRPQVLGIKVGYQSGNWIHKCQQYFELTRRNPLPHHLQQTPLDTSNDSSLGYRFGLGRANGCILSTIV